MGSRTSLVAQRVKHLPAMRKTQVGSLGGEDSPGEGSGNPLQYSCLENPMDGEAWWATVHGVTKSRTRLSDFTHSLERGLALPRLCWRCLCAAIPLCCSLPPWLGESLELLSFVLFPPVCTSRTGQPRAHREQLFCLWPWRSLVWHKGGYDW